MLTEREWGGVLKECSSMLVFFVLNSKFHTNIGTAKLG